MCRLEEAYHALARQAPTEDAARSERRQDRPGADPIFRGRGPIVRGEMIRSEGRTVCIGAPSDGFRLKEGQWDPKGASLSAAARSLRPDPTNDASPCKREETVHSPCRAVPWKPPVRVLNGHPTRKLGDE